jgi:hypothetical protein
LRHGIPEPRGRCNPLGRAAADSALALDPAISISNRLMITPYCLWFAVATWGPARRAS